MKRIRVTNLDVSAYLFLVMDMKHGNEFEGEETEPLLTRPRWPHSARESRFGPSLVGEYSLVISGS